MRIRISLLAGCASLALSGVASAVPISFTEHAAFVAALPAPASVLDFDTVAAGTVIPDGGSVGDITFHYDFGGTQMVVSDAFTTTSEPNFLGTDDGDLFLDGDDFSMSFSPVNALGLFFLTADALFDDDIVLSAGGSSVALDASAVQQTLSDGSDVFFLGIVDDATAFSSATITTVGGGFFFYNVDDITTAATGQAPEPSTFVLLFLGLAVWRAPSVRQNRLR